MGCTSSSPSDDPHVVGHSRHAHSRRIPQMSRNRVDSIITDLEIATDISEHVYDSDLHGIWIPPDGSESGESEILDENEAFFLTEEFYEDLERVRGPQSVSPLPKAVVNVSSRLKHQSFASEFETSSGFGSTCDISSDSETDIAIPVYSSRRRYSLLMKSAR